jgi:ubiquinone biosynthesis protein
MADSLLPSHPLDDDALDAAFDAARRAGDGASDTDSGEPAGVWAPRATDTASPPPRLPGPPAPTAGPPPSPPPSAPPGFDVLEEGPPPSLVRRFLTTWRHAIGLIYGAAVAVARDREQFDFVKGLPLFLIRVAAFFVRPFVRKDLRALPLEVQLRRRLEILGPTYIKLGQVLALRTDIFPTFITDELGHLLDRLPVVPFSRYRDLVARGLGRPVEQMFEWIDPQPLGSASIAQIHRARTLDGDDVIIKVVKPNIGETLKRDARLLGFFGAFLQLFFGKYQPKRVIDEFTEYTLREVDLRREADNARQFTLNFADLPGIRFPRIYPAYSSRSVLTMERFDGLRPDGAAAQQLPLAEREALIDLGAESIIRMLFRDGFFHADLHPGNLFILHGDEHGTPQLGFIDLGMVGYFDGELRRVLMYYYYSLVTGDAENAARYLASIAEPGPGGNVEGFRKAVAEVCRRFQRAANFRDYSLGQMIMESVSLGGRYRVYFPVELVLMVKALVTFEAVGHALLPDFDVARVSQRHANKTFMEKFNPLALGKESLRGLPELIDLLVHAPVIASDALRFVERRVKQPPPNPLEGVKSTLLAGFSLVAGALAAGLGAAWWVWVPLFGLAALFGLGARQR